MLKRKMDKQLAECVADAMLLYKRDVTQYEPDNKLHIEVKSGMDYSVCRTQILRGP